MSCNAPTQQSLRNIDPEPEQCEYTCDYTFKYPSSSQLQLINEKENGFYSIVLDTSPQPSVTFNSSQYSAQNIILLKGPLHNYGGNVDAELIIVHSYHSGPDNTIKNLNVCIPITFTDTESNTELDKLFNDIGDAESTQGSETPILKTQNFKLDKLIPETDYLIYTGNNLTTNDFASNVCPQQDTKYIVFNNLKTSLSSSKINVDKTDFGNFPSASKFFQLGPSNGKVTLYKSQFVPDSGPSGDIYIDCKPVQTTDTKTAFTPVVTGIPAYLSGLSFNDILNSLFPYLLIIIGAAIMYIMYRFGYYMFGPRCPGAGCAPPGEPPLKCTNASPGLSRPA